MRGHDEAAAASKQNWIIEHDRIPAWETYSPARQAGKHRGQEQRKHTDLCVDGDGHGVDHSLARPTVGPVDARGVVAQRVHALVPAWRSTHAANHSVFNHPDKLAAAGRCQHKAWDPRLGHVEAGNREHTTSAQATGSAMGSAKAKQVELTSGSAGCGTQCGPVCARTARQCG